MTYKGLEISMTPWTIRNEYKVTVSGSRRKYRFTFRGTEIYQKFCSSVQNSQNLALQTLHAAFKNLKKFGDRPAIYYGLTTVK